MRAHVIICRNPCDPAVRSIRPVRRRQKIAALAPRTKLPTIAYHNGRVLWRREWRRRVVDGDVIAFVVLPAGGGGKKNPLSIVLSIALMAVSGPIANAMLMEAGAIQVLGGITLKTLVGGAIGLAGNAIINSAFAGKPSSPSPQMANAMAAPSPTYNIQAQGNMARLDAAIPVQYGRMMAYPDFAAQPYAEFAGNEQYLYQLLCIGQGYYEVDEIRIEDTAIASFPEVEYEIIEPGGTLTLFPSNVVTSTEVSGQEAEYNVYLGPYVANASGTTANAIAVDVVAPRGLYYANDSGGVDAVSVTFTVEARTIDSGGAPTGSYVTLGTETFSAATNTPQRYSYRYTGLNGRYEVRLKRTSAVGGTTRYGDDLMWAGLRAYLPETRTWAGQTVIAFRMRASNSLSGQASRKINMIATRKLPIYSGGVWTAPQVTRSPAWAMADALRASYGGGLGDSRIDLDQIITLAATYAARGDTFDARFDNAMTLWEAVSKIGQAVRTKPYIQGGIVHFVRDEAATVPVALFSMRNIIRGSFSIDYLMPTDDTADALDMGYFDGDVWSPRRVTASLPGSAEAVPLKTDIFGVTQREQAYREGMYYAAVNHYRRKRISFATEMEGFIPSFGDLIAISHDMPAWGTSGEVPAVESYDDVSPVAGWTISGASTATGITAPDGEDTGLDITDDSVVQYEYAYSAFESVVSGSSYVRTFFVKKDAVSARFVICRMQFYLAAGGGTLNQTDVALRTDTGDYAVGSSGGGSGSVVVGAWNDNWWQVTVTASCANGNDRLVRLFFPAGGSIWPAVYDATTTGTATLWTGPVTRLTLSEPVTFDAGTYYIGLRNRDGSIHGPYACTAGRTDYEVVIAGLLDATPYTGGAEERTHFAFGLGDAWRQPARVVSVKPRGLYQVEIEAINEDASVHTADSGVTAPAAQFSNLPNLFTTPAVSGLTVRSQLDDPNTIVLSWQAAPGARFYVIEASSDGDTWSRVGETTSNNYTVPALYGNSTLVRIAAHGFTLGSFVQAAYSAYSDYMWSATDTDLMWSATSTDLMWS